jgi:DNA invertase Pin-like site-specific DNA recombinase
MSIPSTSSMMFAMLLDRINLLEQRANSEPLANATSSISHSAPEESIPPTRKEKENKVQEPVVSQDEDTVNEDLDPRTKLMGIGKGEQVAILARVSTAEQKASNRDSIGSQVEACTEQMRALGCKNATLISQIDESASKNGQQLEQFFDNVLAFKKKPVVIVRTISRFSRIYKKGMERLESIQEAGGRIIFGCAEKDSLEWFDTNSPSGLVKFQSQLKFAEQWTREMSITARDNAKRKRQRTEETKRLSTKKGKQHNIEPESTKPTLAQRREAQIEIIKKVLHRNNRDSDDLRRIIDWIRLARRGGTNTSVLGPLKDLVNWRIWARNPKVNDWRREPWQFPEGASESRIVAKRNELSFEWIAANLKAWKIKMPPIRGLGNLQAGWSAELVELMHDVDGTESITQMISQI